MERHFQCEVSRLWFRWKSVIRSYFVSESYMFVWFFLEIRSHLFEATNNLCSMLHNLDVSGHSTYHRPCFPCPLPRQGLLPLPLKSPSKCGFPAQQSKLSFSPQEISAEMQCDSGVYGFNMFQLLWLASYPKQISSWCPWSFAVQGREFAILIMRVLAAVVRLPRQRNHAIRGSPAWPKRPLILPKVYDFSLDGFSKRHGPRQRRVNEHVVRRYITNSSGKAE